MESETRKFKIVDLGYNSFFEASRIDMGLADFAVARVVAEHKGGYRVKNEKGEFWAKIKGKQIFKALSREDFPAVGDWVVIDEIDEQQVMIQMILPRKTIMKRKFGDKDRLGQKDKIQVIAANIDVALVIESVDRDFSLNRFERYFSIARNSGIEIAVILNKTDLLALEELAQKIDQIQKRLGTVQVIPTSTLTKQGLAELAHYIEKGRTYCFLGSSGVGKSTLINKLLGTEDIKTGSIGEHSGRGTHVTTSREMYFLENGGIVIDNPGVREVGITDAQEGIDNLFDEIATLATQCKYFDCTHVHEPGCAVLAAVKAGDLAEGQYANYISLKKEAQQYSLNKREKRNKNRQFGRFINKAKKSLKNVGHKDY